MQTSRAAFGDGQRAMCGHGRDADACAELEPGAVREREDAFGRKDSVLLGGAAGRTAVAGEGDPDSLPDGETGGSGADRVDDAGAVVVRNRRLGDRAAVVAGAGLPVG